MGNSLNDTINYTFGYLNQRLNAFVQGNYFTLYGRGPEVEKDIFIFEPINLFPEMNPPMRGLCIALFYGPLDVNRTTGLERQKLNASALNALGKKYKVIRMMNCSLTSKTERVPQKGYLPFLKAHVNDGYEYYVPVITAILTFNSDRTRPEGLVLTA